MAAVSSEEAKSPKAKSKTTNNAPILFFIYTIISIRGEDGKDEKVKL